MIASRDEHTHPADGSEIEAEKIVKRMKDKAMTTLQPITAIYQDEIQHLAQHENRTEIAERIPPLMQIKSSLYEVRRKRLPALPQSRAEVHFENEWAKTCSGENFLLAEDGEGDSKIVVFAADGNLKLLCDAETIYVDGTFSTCPHLFYQIFTFHAFRHGKQFPLVYCLLPNKRRETYIRSFEIVKQKAEQL